MSEPRPVALTVAGEARPTRRQAIQWVMAAAAAASLPRRGSAQTSAETPVAAAGYGRDPELLKFHKPGDFWPLTFTAQQRETAAALADVIIPNDELGPAATSVGVVEMLDEWVSAPYAQQQEDRPIILNGLAWIDSQSLRRFGKPFAHLSTDQKRAICDDICLTKTARPEFRKAAEFFGRFRSLCSSAYYATPAGWKAIGYVGNVPLERFDGPPPEVLARLGVRQSVD